MPREAALGKRLGHRPEVIAQAVATYEDLDTTAQALVEVVRLPSGSLMDDVAVAVVRCIRCVVRGHPKLTHCGHQKPTHRLGRQVVLGHEKLTHPGRDARLPRMPRKP